MNRILTGTTILLFAVPVFLAAAGPPLTPQIAVATAISARPAALAAPPAGDSQRITQFLIFSGDSWNGSWESSQASRYKKWRAQYGSHFAWFRQHGRDYIVNDDRTLAEVQNAMAPQREVNRQQDEVNRHQDAVNRQQEQVNSHQEDANHAQAEVNRQQGLVNAGAGSQDRVNRLQSDVNGKQQTVNAEQEKVNRQEAVVNQEQAGVNRLQTRASAEIDHALQSIFDSARQRGLAHEIH